MWRRVLGRVRGRAAGVVPRAERTKHTWFRASMRERYMKREREREGTAQQDRKGRERVMLFMCHSSCAPVEVLG